MIIYILTRKQTKKIKIRKHIILIIEIQLINHLLLIKIDLELKIVFINPTHQVINI